MKVFKIQHSMDGLDGKPVPGDFCIVPCGKNNSEIMSVLETEFDGLCEGATEFLLISCEEMSDEEFSNLPEFEDW